MAEIFYASFYGLRAPPFHVTPDASLFFATDTHQQAMAAIEYGVVAGKGFIVVTGEVGVGKTTVLRAVLDRFDPAKNRVIYLFDPDLSVAELYLAVLDGLDREAVRGMEPGEALRQVQEALLRFNERGVAVVLAVDEAQNMAESTLEHLRLLSNLETPKSKLLQIVLVGQPELDAILRRPSMRQLAQRIAVRARIAPLSFAQSCRYIVHRLACCGRPMEPPLFSTPALWYIAWRARGIPRSLNILCDNALINGYGHSATRLTLPIVHEAVKPLLRWSLHRSWGWVAAAALSLVLGGIYLHSARTPTTPVRAAAEPAASGESDASVASPPAKGAAPAAAAVAQPPVALGNKAQTASPAPAASAAGGDTASDVADQGSQVSATDDAEVETPASSADDSDGSQGASVGKGPPDSSAPAGRRASDHVHRKGSLVRTWHVKRGDTLFKACVITYGRCDPADIKAIIALNPKLRSRRVLWIGDVILLPTVQPDSASNRARPN